MTKKDWEKKKTMEFHKLAVEVKKWFEDKEIDVGYTDTNVGHFAIYIQNKLAKQKKEIVEILESRIEDTKKLNDKVSAEYIRLFLDQVIKTVKKT